MKRTVNLLILLLCLCLDGLAEQRITMQEEHLAYSFSDGWIVVSPQLAAVLSPLLAEHGIDGATLSQDLTDQGIAARAYNPDFTQWISVLTHSDDLTEEIFDITNATDAQRRTLKNRTDNNSVWETTGYRTQDSEWIREGDVYWLYVHYIRTTGDQTIGRGIRYMTIRNGAWIELDWQRGTARFSNREISSLRGRLSSLEVTETLEAPIRTVKLNAQIPQETPTDELRITGTTTSGATLVAEAPDGSGTLRTLSVAQAGSDGKFSMIVPLEKEGTYELTLTAQKDGMNPVSTYGTVVFDPKTLPVTLSAADGDIVTTDTVTITGQTLAGVSMQFVTPYGMTKKRSDNSGNFSFDVTTKNEGSYSYTLILDKSGYNERRVQFTLSRVMTDDQEKQQVRDEAVRISYRELQRDLDTNRGKILRLYGPVTEVSSGGGSWYVRMSYTKDNSGKWSNTVILTSQENLGVKVGDMLTAVVEVAGVYEEQNSNGQSIMIPKMNLKFVDKIE